MSAISNSDKDSPGRPGFNDTFRSETDVLRDISTWLRDQYESENKLAGIVYLHGINHPRVEGSALRNLKMFRELCGLDALENIILVTTFWGDVEPHIGEKRERELASKEAFWGGMLERGSRMARFKDQASGQEILRSLVGLPPKPLKIQQEMVEEEIALVDTGAGQIVNDELLRLEEKHKKDMVQLHHDMDEAMQLKDAELQQVLREQELKLEEKMDKVQRQQEQLRADRRAEARRMQGEFEDAMYALRKQNDMEVSNLKDDVEQLQDDVRRREHDREAQAERFQEIYDAQERRIQDLQDHNQESRAAQEIRMAELERYNEEARKKYEGLDIEGIIAKVRAEESKLHAEDREKLEQEIGKLQRVPTSRKRDKLPGMFFSVLRAALPIATLLTLGVPIALPSPNDSEP